MIAVSKAFRKDAREDRAIHIAAAAYRREDAAGYVEVASLKGIHYAMQSGMFAARAAFAMDDHACSRNAASGGGTGLFGNREPGT